MVSTPLIAQTALRDILHEFHKLRPYSIKYETYRELNEPEYAERKKAHKKKYMDQINYIKKGPNRAIYIQFLNDATGKDSLRHQKQIWYILYICSSNPYSGSNKNANNV